MRAPLQSALFQYEKEGFENKIAEMIAAELGVSLEYEWFPQSIGFIRNTLRNDDTPDGSYKCDLVVGVVQNFELAMTTRPYYRSTWVIVYGKGRGLDDIQSPQDLINLSAERREKLNIASFDQGPGTDWLFKYGFVENIRPRLIMPGDVRANAGNIITEDLIPGTVDLAIMWGPIAGYHAKKLAASGGPQLQLVPLGSEPNIPFEYNISMAVRFGEKQWKQRLDEIIAAKGEEITAILKDYGVPLLEIPEGALQEEDDDDDDD